MVKFINSVGFAIQVLSIINFIASMVALTIMSFVEIDMTEARFFVTYWKWFLLVPVHFITYIAGCWLTEYKEN